MIRQDAISKAFTVLAFAELIFLATFTGQIATASLIAAVILAAGLVLDRLSKFDSEDATVTEQARGQIIQYVGISVLVFVALDNFIYALPAFVTVSSTGLDWFQAHLFGILIAVAEEQFFRGFLMNWLMVKTRTLVVAYLMDGLIFAVYHLAVYGTSPANLAIVFGAGVTLAVVDWKAQRVSPSIIAHVINNLLVV